MLETLKVDPSASLGSSFAAALALKDFDRLRELPHPEVDLRGLTPRRAPEAEERVGWMRAACSGFRPVEGE